MNTFELVGQLSTESPQGQHSMVVHGRYIYIIDGNKLVRLYVPQETIWAKILRWLGIKK